MKNLKIILSLIFLLIISASYGQKNTRYFYYYKGEKLFLELNTEVISVTTNDNSTNSFNAPSQKASKVIEDHTRSSLITTDAEAKSRQQIKTHYLEIISNKSKTEIQYLNEVTALNKKTNVVLASPSFKDAEGKTIGLSNNFSVKLKSEEDVNILYKKVKQFNLEVLGQNKYLPLWYTVSCTKNSKSNALVLANLFYETGLFEYVEPAFMIHGSTDSIDPLFANQWGLKNTGQNGNEYIGIDIKTEDAWPVSKGDDIKVAIFDTGFQLDHPDLATNVHGLGYDVVTNGPSQIYITTSDGLSFNHGTLCAGLIGAIQNNSRGISGVAPISKLISVSMPIGIQPVTPTQIVNGFIWAVNAGAKVISNSWNLGGVRVTQIDDAIDDAILNGAVVVFSAGNEDNPDGKYPSNSNPKILNVGAINKCGSRKTAGNCTDFGTTLRSNYGSTLDIMAPGQEIVTTSLGGFYDSAFKDTSAACAIVAGVAALVLKANPSLSVQDVSDIIEKSAQKINTTPQVPATNYIYSLTSGRPNGTWNNEMGYGLVNAYQAVLLAQSYICYPNLSISIKVAATGIDQKQAINTITATNIIEANASAIYRAGNSIILSSGFHSKSGSRFRGYIDLDVCTNNDYVARKSNPTKSSFSVDNVPNNLTIDESKIIMFPNPTNSSVTISCEGFTIDELSVFSLDGKEIYRKEIGNITTYELNSSNFSSGIYLVNIKTSNGNRFQKKLVKK